MGYRPDLVESVSTALRSRKGTRQRTGDQGEQWLDCRCPLHNDAHRSASFSTDRGTFVCRVCDPAHAIPIERVATALSVPDAPPLHSNGTPAAPRLQEPLIEAARWSYDYYWPNAELSHRHWRIQYANLDPATGKPRKRYLHQAPSGDWTRPSTYYPLYSDLGIPRGAHVVITEGEPACDAVNSRELQIAGIGVHAITAGSTADLQQCFPILKVRLQELAPASVTLWPDADEPGIKAMRELRKRLQEAHIPAALVNPEDYQLSNKQDAVEFLQKGGNLALMLSTLQRPVTIRPQDVADSMTVLRDGALWPGTQSLAKLDQASCSALWQSVTGHMPLDREAKELSNILRRRAAMDPTDAYWRVRPNGNYTVWRPSAQDDCFRLSAEGIDVVPGLNDGILLCPGAPEVPPGIDLNLPGEAYFGQLCEFFGLGGLEQTLVLAWWICCLTGRETPIMLMRGAAGTGKSTLASFILGLVEPTLREVHVPDQRAWSDERALIQTLRQVPAILADNVSALSGSMEDVLSKLVTGYNNSVMWKYSNEVEQVRMRRGIILTTTNYDVYKGDLASRCIVVQPQTQGGWEDRDRINRRFMPMLPAIRGYVFQQACRTYLEHESDHSFRVASIGDVLSALGYDAPELARQEAHEKARTLNQNDPWMWAIVDIWERHNEGGEFLFSHAQIVDAMREFGVPLEDLPRLGSPKFSRWIEEKQMLLRDHGFWLERYRDEQRRGYWFRRA